MRNIKRRLLQLPVYIIPAMLFLIAFDQPECTNDNPIFNTNTPDSKRYKDELVSQLKIADPSELKYWLQKYEKQNGIESLYFYVQGDGLCAILHLTVFNWKKLEHVRAKKGVGRRGAEFTNLQFTIHQDTLSTDFIYATFDYIID